MSNPIYKPRTPYPLHFSFPYYLISLLLYLTIGVPTKGFRNVDYYSDDEDAMGIDLSNTAEFPSNLSPDGSDFLSPRGGADDGKEEAQQFHGVSFAQMLNKKSQVVSPPQAKGRNSAPVYRSLQGNKLSLLLLFSFHVPSVTRGFPRGKLLLKELYEISKNKQTKEL